MDLWNEKNQAKKRCIHHSQIYVYSNQNKSTNIFAYIFLNFNYFIQTTLQQAKKKKKKLNSYQIEQSIIWSFYVIQCSVFRVLCLFFLLLLLLLCFEYKCHLHMWWIENRDAKLYYTLKHKRREKEEKKTSSFYRRMANKTTSTRGFIWYNLNASIWCHFFHLSNNLQLSRFNWNFSCSHSWHAIKCGTNKINYFFFGNKLSLAWCSSNSNFLTCEM